MKHTAKILLVDDEPGMPLAVSVPFPDRYEEYSNALKSNLSLVANTWVPAFLGLAWYALVVVVGKSPEVVVPATKALPWPSTSIPTG